MATNHEFKATSANMGVAYFGIAGHFVLNGSVNAQGSVEITPSANPGREAAYYTGELTSPQIKIEFNSVGWDGLLQRLQAAHSVEISFTSAEDLGSSPALTRLNSFRISARRRYE